MSTDVLSPPKLSRRFEDALVYAAVLHAGQERKDTGVPYVAHLLGVAALVLEDGGDEDEAIAALLHDAAEDQGGIERLRAIAGRYGERVARIVMACTDSLDEPKLAWAERKRRYLAHLIEQPAGVLRVSVADKLHNARAIVADLRRDGVQALDTFSGGRQGVPWYYGALTGAFREAGLSSPLRDEFERVVAELIGLATEPAGISHDDYTGEVAHA